MIISCNNIREIENINLHDAYIENVIYNHSNKVINVELESEWEKTDYDLSFHEVLYYEMTCCDFWGCGYNVICWSKFDTTEIFDKLLRIDRIEKAESNSDKVINVELESEWEKTDYDLSFHEVLYYEMTCCDFWGCGYNVICWSKFDTTEIFDKLLRIDRIEKAESNSESNTIMDLSEYIGIDILLNSGDHLKIICKSVIIS